jgi:Flp pilus assembly protein TadD
MESNNDVNNYFIQAKNLVSLGKYNESLKLFDKALALHPTNSNLLNDKANA